MKKNLFHIKFIVVCLLCIALQTVYGQSKTLRFDHINTESGLPKNQVLSLCQDHVGFIWTGTGEGLSRYDGYRFKTYNAKNSNLFGNDVVAIYEDEEHTLWLGTNKGLSKFDRRTESFENFAIDSVLITGNKKFHVNTIFEDNAKRLWIGTDKGLFLFNRRLKTFNKNWSQQDLKNDLDGSRIQSIYQDSDSRLWISTENGVFLIDFNPNNIVTKISHTTFAALRVEGAKDHRVSSVIEDKNGTIWFATRIGLYRLDSKIDSSLVDAKFSKIQIPFLSDVSYFEMMSSIVVDADNGLIVGHLNGLYYLPNDSNKLENLEVITNDPELKHNYSMNTQFIDESGVLWVTSHNGIYKHDLNLKKFKVFRADQNKPESRRQNLVWSIFKDSQNTTWIGTTYGLHKLVWSNELNKYEYQHVPNNEEIREGEKGLPVHDILELDDNYLIIATSGGLYRLNKSTLVFSEIQILLDNTLNSKPLKSNFPSKLCWGKNDVIWMGTNQGLLKYDAKRQTFKRYKLPKIKGVERNNKVDVVYLDEKNRLWVGTHAGINLFLPEEEKFYPIEFTKNTSFKSVWTVHSPGDNTLWIGTWGSGIYHLIPTEEKLNFEEDYKIEEYHVKDGLSNEYVYAILPDEEGNLWMSTNLGISNFNLKTKRFENYTVDDGLQSNEFNSGAYFKAKDGEMFFGGPSGINSFYPSAILKNKTIPKVVLTGLWVNNKEVLFQGNGTDKITLEYGETPIKFDFAALSFNQSSKNKYLIKVDNYDDSWIGLGNHTSFTLSKLPPGNYIFKVKGSNSDGYWNEGAAVLNFTVLPPFWKTAWFYVLCVILIIGLFYSIFRARLHQIKLKTEKLHFEEQNEIKTVMIKETHHRVKNNLQIINSLLRLQSSQIEDPDVIRLFKDAENRVLSMAQLHEKMYQSFDLKHIDVKEHFVQLINELVRDYEVGVKISLDLKIEEVQLGIKTLVPLGLLVNEMITNSLKYAFKGKKEGEIIVYLKHLEGIKYELIIGDNGVGISANTPKESDSFGTELIQIFTSQLNGSIEKMGTSGTQFKIVFEKVDKS